MEMEGSSRNEEAFPQLLDLIPKDRDWVVKREDERNHKSSVEKKLELRLGPPGEDWSIKKISSRERDESLVSVGYFSSMSSMHINGTQNQKMVGAVLPCTWSSSSRYQQLKQQPKGSSFLQSCCTQVVDMQKAEEKVFSPPPAANTAVPNTSQKRTAPAPVVGWPPIRSFRKNLGSSSSPKPASETPNVVTDKADSVKPIESGRKGLFVKINMDGVPIGRKVDLKAYDSYEKLSTAVDQLFRGLLAAQRVADGIQKKQEKEKAITGVLDGSGEYTLVYEDNEGDRMLVGDVPWHMFVSTVRRLRVLKSSELSVLSLGSRKQGKITN